MMDGEFQNCSNTSDRLSSTKVVITWNKIFMAVILYAITFVTIFGNVLVLIAVKMNKKLQTTFNYYIVNLAITDVAVAVTAMSFMATHTVLGYWPFGEALCAVWIFFDYGMTFVSVFTLNLISVDRFWSVKWSVHYRQHHTKRKGIIAIVFVWLFMLILWVPPWLMDRLKHSKPGECFWDPSLNKEFVFILALLGHHVPFCIMILSYLYVLYFMRKRSTYKDANRCHTRSTVIIERQEKCENALKKSSSATRSHDSRGSLKQHVLPPQKPCANGANNLAIVHILQKANTLEKDVQKVRRESKFTRDKRLFVTMTYIILGYSILWLPFHIVFDVSIAYPGWVSKDVLNILFWMTYFNSTINPILYNFSCFEFRKTFQKILIKCKSK